MQAWLGGRARGVSIQAGTWILHGTAEQAGPQARYRGRQRRGGAGIKDATKRAASQYHRADVAIEQQHGWFGGGGGRAEQAGERMGRYAEGPRVEGSLAHAEIEDLANGRQRQGEPKRPGVYAEVAVGGPGTGEGGHDPKIPPFLTRVFSERYPPPMCDPNPSAPKSGPSSPQEWARRFARLFLLGVILLGSGCGPVISSYLLIGADAELAGARAAEAEKYASYEYIAASEYLHKAKEEYGYADYGPAIDFAWKAQELAKKGTTKANLQRHRYVSDDAEVAPAASPGPANDKKNASDDKKGGTP